MLLTPTERRRFVEYCREAAESCKQISGQLRLLDRLHMLVHEQDTKAASYTIVANDLDSVEESFITTPSSETNSPPPQYVWLNVYRERRLNNSRTTKHDSREDADNHAVADRIGCLRVLIEERFDE